MRCLIQIVTRYIPRHWMQLFALKLLWILSFFYRGNRFIDPIDGTRYRKLLPYGRNESRKNALAPSSGSLERHRVIWLFLQTETNFFTQPIKFLHIAPEYCFLKPFKKLKHIEYLTGDLNSPWADIKLDIRNMPFENETFDAAMCNHVFEHIDNDIQAMKEFYRILKPGGWAIFQVPIHWDQKTIEDPTITSPKERERLFGQRDHVRYYGYDYIERLQTAGFHVDVIDYAQKIGHEKTQLYALLPTEKIIFCRKI
ncbi:MAG TPA: methyltransferase domain-containing protein [Salinivirgaceae bacterium]|nr:methyltransferase domain-containing protein [Salinivirgaceae bacterium]